MNARAETIKRLIETERAGRRRNRVYNLFVIPVNDTPQNKAYGLEGIQNGIRTQTQNSPEVEQPTNEQTKEHEHEQAKEQGGKTRGGWVVTATSEQRDSMSCTNSDVISMKWCMACLHRFLKKFFKIFKNNWVR